MRAVSSSLALTLALLACENPIEIPSTGGSGGGGSGGAAGGAGGATGGSGGEGLIFVGGMAGGGAGGAAGGGGAPPPACGDGTVDPGEACDDGNGSSGDGCTGTCDAIENGFACPVPGQLCVSTVVCPDGVVSGLETCDDGNADPGDGCDATCQLEPGWACPDPGVACEAAACGDGVVAGDEECEDGGAPPAPGDGCDASCQLEPGFKCDQPGQPCVPTVCGDGVKEGSEQCDDGDNDMGDGCTPFCENEPSCVGVGPCTTSCGDGIKLPGGSEQCEDGNTEAGDGCSPTCQKEPGYDCVDVAIDPNQLVLPIVLRDFKVSHPDMEDFLGVDLGIVGPLLGADQKPVYAGSPTTPTTSGGANFAQWYSDVMGVNLPILQTITLAKQPSGVFQYANANFFPLDGIGFGNEGNPHNFHFTSEVRYWFEYKGGESLQFTGDDDVWVFVNKQLAVNLGGVHGAMSGGITLDAGQASTLGLAVGSIYEIVVFQAERHTTQSNYQLTLGNFVNATSVCTPICGDGIKTPNEQCDDGVNDGSYGHCTVDCKKGPRCGDGVVQAADGEACDDGVNLTPYGVGCAPGCKEPGTCGDGVVDSLFGEDCDDGTNDGGYGECEMGCQLGPYCGDGVVQSPMEDCDDGNKVSGDGCSSGCQNEVN